MTLSVIASLREVACDAARMLRRACILMLATGCLMPLNARAEDEYALKAAFLFHFLNYVTWPEEVFASPDEPIRLCLVGRDPFGKLIEPIAAKRAQGRAIELVRLPGSHDDGPCQLAYISGADDEIRQRLAAWSSPGVLTVGDATGFSELGGVIGYVMVENRVRFVLNDEAAERARLQVSVKLRKVALQP